MCARCIDGHTLATLCAELSFPGLRAGWAVSEHRHSLIYILRDEQGEVLGVCLEVHDDTNARDVSWANAIVAALAALAALFDVPQAYLGDVFDQRVAFHDYSNALYERLDDVHRCTIKITYCLFAWAKVEALRNAWL